MARERAPAAAGAAELRPAQSDAAGAGRREQHGISGADLLENANPTAAIYCKTGECEIRITARAKPDEDAETMCRAYAKKFYDLLGDAVYDEDVAGLEETVVHTLQRRVSLSATAESCTGGMIAQRITSCPVPARCSATAS